MQRIIFALLLVLTPIATLAQSADQSSSPDLARIKVLDLTTAQTVALAGNPSMAAAQARVEQARARVRQAVASW